MPSVFATPDIAALVSAFPPPEPTSDRPSLVPSYSGHILQASDAVVSDFRSLLEKAPSRIKLTDLPERLNVERVDWLLDTYHDPLYYSSDGQSLLPQTASKEIRSRIWSTVTTGLLDLIVFAHDCDISLESLELLVQVEKQRRPGQLIEYVDFKAAERKWIYSERYASIMQSSIASTLTTTEEGSKPLNLSHDYMFSDAPPSLIQQMTEEVLSKNASIKGSVEMRKQSVFFTPADYADAQATQRRNIYQKQIDELVESISEDGYCLIPTHPEGGESASRKENRATLIQDVQSKYEDQHMGAEWVTLGKIGSGDTTVALWLSNRLDTFLNPERVAETVVTDLWSKRDSTKSESVFKSNALQALASKLTTDTELSTLLTTSTPSRSKLETSVATQITTLEAKDTETFTHLLQTQLLAPLALYTTSLATATEPTLQTNLSTFYTTHLKTETLPALLTTLRTANLLTTPPRAREFEKYQTALQPISNLNDFTTATQKLTRKLKVPAPTQAQITEVRTQTLRHKASVVRKLPRASDVLQNLIWMVLAQAGGAAEGEQTGGLYMSSGKDTTRMIRLYQALGDEEVGKKLEAWRDVLKEGKESKDDVREMRALAQKAVEEICGMVQKNGDGEGVA